MPPPFIREEIAALNIWRGQAIPVDLGVPETLGASM
jgi:hypothetical protein